MHINQTKKVMHINNNRHSQDNTKARPLEREGEMVEVVH